jgi:hypothetical protein
MAKSIRDIVPDFAVPTVRPPADVLGELASQLGARVGYKLGFHVVSGTIGNTVSHRFQVTLQALDYVGELFTVTHDVACLYPVRVSGMLVTAGGDDIGSEEELIEFLNSVLNSGKAKQMLGTLLVQA